jgi:hypothetical protein
MKNYVMSLFQIGIILVFLFQISSASSILFSLVTCNILPSLAKLDLFSLMWIKVKVI